MQKRRNNILALMLLLGGFVGGCTYNATNPVPDSRDVQAKQEQGLRDPINYKSDENTDPYDISGGGINNLDKGALNRDIHHVFDP